MKSQDAASSRGREYRVAHVSPNGEVLERGGFVSQEGADLIERTLRQLSPRPDKRRVAFLPPEHEMFLN